MNQDLQTEEKHNWLNKTTHFLGENAVLTALIFVTLVYIYIVIQIVVFAQGENCKLLNLPYPDCGFICQLASKIHQRCGSLGLNEVGDYMAGFFAPFAIIWFAIAFLWQARELKLQRLEFEKAQEASFKQLELTNIRNEEETKRFVKQQTWITADSIRSIFNSSIKAFEKILEKENSYFHLDLAVSLVSQIDEIQERFAALNQPRDRKKRERFLTEVFGVIHILERSAQMCDSPEVFDAIPTKRDSIRALEKQICSLKAELS